MSAQSHKLPKHFIVIVPGIMGSKLRDQRTNEIVWINFPSILQAWQWKEWLDKTLSTLAFPNDNLRPAGIMDEVVFMPPWAKQQHYGRLFNKLEGMGYRVDPKRYPESELDAYSFSYDWRQDNRISARQLGRAIENWQVYHPESEVWIIAHSNGGLVARWYIEREGGNEHVGRLILMGSPWDGAPRAMNVLFSGFDTFFRRRFNIWNIPQRTRDLVRTFPSLYQLLPYRNPFLSDLNNEPVDLFGGEGWLHDEQQRQLLADGRKFNEELGIAASAKETLWFFGRKKYTPTFGKVHLEAGGNWRTIDWGEAEAGDGTVPDRSARDPNGEKDYPFTVGHGRFGSFDGSTISG